MNIFFSGIGGVGIGALAQLAQDAGHAVTGSDAEHGLMTEQLTDRGIEIHYKQDGHHLKKLHKHTPIDWFVHTAALPNNHPELHMAKHLGIKCTKRDDLLKEIIAEKDLQLIAASGTHGKTSTTGMLIWAMQQLGMPASYSIGTTLNFGASGKYVPGSKYFIYECDEFDQNFLQFSPYLSLITTVGYDHVDTYPSRDDYFVAFSKFLSQSNHSIGWRRDFAWLPNIPEKKLWQLQDDETQSFQVAGEHNRRNATLVLKALEYLNLEHTPSLIESFPGTNRRFEKLADNLYSDYGHHPTEIAATLQLAGEISNNVILVYQPHQNTRQYEIKPLYRDAFTSASRTYWLPTYLSREDKSLPVMRPVELISDIPSNNKIEIADLNDDLWEAIEQHRLVGHLVLCMGAGSIDSWVRNKLESTQKPLTAT
jgi:UDP-N-acetylmuramate--alanine ligase